MVRQWQEMFYDERYSEVYLSPDLPDFVKWAEAMGCVGIRVESPEEVQPAIDKANSIDDRPVVVDFRVDCRARRCSRWCRPAWATTTCPAADRR